MSAQPIDLTLALMPTNYGSEAAAYGFKESFEAFSKSQGLETDLTIKVFHPFDFDSDKLENELQRFDVAEIDICQLEALVSDLNSPHLDKIPTEVLDGRLWFPPVKEQVAGKFAGFFVPHWLRMFFFINWSQDTNLTKAVTFDAICNNLDPSVEHFAFSDLWGDEPHEWRDEPLGHAYVDAMIDIKGAAETQLHLKRLSDSEDTQLDPAAVLQLWRLSEKMKKEHLQKRKELHQYPITYARGFADKLGSCLYGPLSLLGDVERLAVEEPWRLDHKPLLADVDPWPNKQLPLQKKTLPPESKPKDDITLRQMTYGSESKGTPVRITSFVIPGGKLAAKQQAILCLLKFCASQEGYTCFLKPNSELPGTYHIPADSTILLSEFVTQGLPLLNTLVTETKVTVTDTPVPGVTLTGVTLAGVTVTGVPVTDGPVTDGPVTDGPVTHATILTYPLLDGAFVIPNLTHHRGIVRAGSLLKDLLKPAAPPNPPET